ncbi:uncharacterized protein E0L32_008548 [Thyridium curvatum]|uniref:Amino-acid acetyltransferase, mitochondrial n=1 Tax=Thyridium curvatum TaxID=1093900 RepID=A0A507B0K1_9PEZI|nr:uncharacterized protein E0L32_008548 [Thyridium curvatum]TPX10498.1 hypothetical protein E0L32_008548 [Thyridium curvatum]
MLSRPAWKKATSAAPVSLGQLCGKRRKSSSSTPTAPSTHVSTPSRGKKGGESKLADITSLYSAASRNEKEKKSQGRDFLASVLASTPTKRDAKLYLQTFGPSVQGGKGKSHKDAKVTESPQSQLSSGVGRAAVPGEGIRAIKESPKFIQGSRAEPSLPPDDVPHIAIVKLREPQSLDDGTFSELAKTLAQLRALGLPSIVVVACDLDPAARPDWFDFVNHQALRLARAIDAFDGPQTRVVDSSLAIDTSIAKSASPFVPSGVTVQLEKPLLGTLSRGAIAVIPSFAISTDRCEATVQNSNDVILALTRFFCGLQFSDRGTGESTGIGQDNSRAKKAAIDRVIVIDPLGGIPAKHRPNGAHVFVNMEEEFAIAKADIDSIVKVNNHTLGSGLSARQIVDAVKQKHRENLELAKNTLALLPSTSSAVITTPAEAANLLAPERSTDEAGVFGYVGTVGTRKSQNPLIHNLLTDRPVYSSSLPLGRVKPKTRSTDVEPPRLSSTTLLKRGMPVTIFPDPRIQPWVPPRPGGPRLRLTDTCVDLPRLVHLINDSFNRELDVQHYLSRVQDSLAGVIIAGEYEGGAILTWERPFGMDEETAYGEGRLVPYLDKFAVLKKSQGAGGVADIVFNAMVRDCFPEGVCWRSRKDNPVNKWYFERSRGTWKLDDTNWAMFWTTPWSAVGERKIWDYEDVCRNIAPSWADKKSYVD